MTEAFFSASSEFVVARMFLDNVNSEQWVGFLCATLMPLWTSSREDDDVRERVVPCDQGGHGGPERARAEEADLLHHVSKDTEGRRFGDLFP